MKLIKTKEVIELTCRLYVFIFLNTYGFAKLFGQQFYTPNTIPDDVGITPIAQIPDFELAWTFMGRSYGYMLFIGISEILGAWLLLFRTSKLFGALMLIVILINIIVFDLFFLDAYGAMASAIIYLLMLVTILWLNKEAVSSSLNQLMQVEAKSGAPKKRIAFYTVTFLLMGSIFIFDQLLVNWLGHGKG